MQITQGVGLAKVDGDKVEVKKGAVSMGQQEAVRLDEAGTG